MAPLQKRVRDLLLEALATLPQEDRLIVKMRQQFSIAEIARTLNLEARRLYRRLDRIYTRLRSILESKGIRAEDIAEELADILRDPEQESNKPSK